MVPRLSVVFRRLVRLGSFPACWRHTNVTPIRSFLSISENKLIGYADDSTLMAVVPSPGVRDLPVLEYCSAAWCSAADTHLKLLDRAVSGARFLTGGVFECDISHRRSVAVLCILYKIRCNPMHPLNGALPGPYVSVRVTLGALVAHRYIYEPPCCRTSQ